MIGAPGKPVMMSDLVGAEEYHKSPLYRLYGRKHRVAHTLGTVQFEPLTALYEFVTVRRTNAAKPFSERDRRFKELVMPRMCEAARSNRQAFVKELSTNARSAPWLLCDGNGVISDIHPAMVHRLRASFPDWVRAKLPEALEALLESGEMVLADGLALQARRSGQQWTVSTLDGPQLAALTVRERSVAQAYAEGKTYLQIADEQGRAPGTIRNQLASVYRKLGITSKTELVRRLANQDPDGEQDPGVAS